MVSTAMGVSESWIRDRKSGGGLQSVHHQELDDESLRFFAEVGEHALLKRHVVVADIQGGGSVVLAGKRRHAGQAKKKNINKIVTTAINNTYSATTP